MATASSSSIPSSSRDRHFAVRVPCTSANIGPGFDVVGLSLSLHLTLDVTVSSNRDNPAPTLEYSGEGAKEAPLDPYKNLTTRCALYVLRCAGIKSFPKGIAIKVHNEIPFGRGLGSSGAAVIAGIVLGDALGELGLSKERLLDHALMIERHPDNVAAALIGGFVGSYLLDLSPEDAERKSVPLSEVLPEYPADAGEEWGKDPPAPPLGIGHFIRFGWAKEIKVITIIPQFEVPTAKARSALPEMYKKEDLVFNLQRLAVLTTALSRSPPDSSLIYQAMQDRVHQPYRAHLIPALPRLLASVTPQSHPGLLGICLSGAGPTILALATHNHEAVAESIVSEFTKEGIECVTKFLQVTEEGATVTQLS
ncbi:unnamed protein product [Parajaminaea phylloscopi]